MKPRPAHFLARCARVDRASAVDLGHAPRRSQIIARRRTSGARTASDSQRLSISAAQHAHDWPDGGRLFSDHCRQRISTRSAIARPHFRQRRRWLRAGGSNRSADLPEFELAGWATKLGFHGKIRTASCQHRSARADYRSRSWNLFAARQEWRRCQLLEFISTTAAADSGGYAGIHRARRICLGRDGGDQRC